ncbi:MAG: IclR family transcriptional regulator [Sedimentisphaerales bacterium]|nr:IclR family transcriptional regulator [Sedimentisphaerales bacterium]
MNNRYVVPNLAKACQVLRHLAHNPDGVSSVQLEEALNIARTTTFRILKTLAAEGFVEKRESKYYVGPGLVELGLCTVNTLQLRDLALKALRDLTGKIHETSHLAIPNGYHSMILEVCDSPKPVRVASRPGTLVPLNCSSTGKIFLAYLFMERLEEILAEEAFEKRTDHSLVSLADLKAESQRVCELGYAVDNEEYYEGVRCLAAPVKNRRGEVVAAIGITATVAGFPRKSEPEMARAVLAAAQELSRKLQ